MLVMASESPTRKEKKFPSLIFSNKKDAKGVARDQNEKHKSNQNHSPEDKEPGGKRSNHVNENKSPLVDDSINVHLFPATGNLDIHPESPSGDVLDSGNLYYKPCGSLECVKYDLVEIVPARTSSMDLTVLAARLCKTENRLLRVENKLEVSEISCKRKDLKIAALQEKLAMQLLEFNSQHPTSEEDSQSSSAAVSPRMSDELMHLKAKCNHLQKQVHEMMNFLADYGLMWVGESHDGKSKTPGSTSNRPCNLDFTKLLHCIEELNQLASYGEPQVSYRNDGTTFKDPGSIPLVLYANGLTLLSGPFRAFTDLGTWLFVQDILDGFFPSELQHAYPDGVYFQVTDKHDVSYEEGRSWKPFKGQGYRLGCKEDNGGNRDHPSSVADTSKDVTPVEQCQASLSTEPGNIHNQVVGSTREKDHTEADHKTESARTPVSYKYTSTNAPDFDYKKDEKEQILRLQRNTVSCLPKLSVGPSSLLCNPEKLKEIPPVTKKRYKDIQISNSGSKNQIRNGSGSLC